MFHKFVSQKHLTCQNEVKRSIVNTFVGHVTNSKTRIRTPISIMLKIKFTSYYHVITRKLSRNNEKISRNYEKIIS